MLPVTLRGLSGHAAAAGVLRLSRSASCSSTSAACAPAAGRRWRAARSRSRCCSRARAAAWRRWSTPANFSLHCVPAINLFPKRADRIAGRRRAPRVPRRARPHRAAGLRGLRRAVGHGYDDERPASAASCPSSRPTTARRHASRPTTRSGASRACCPSRRGAKVRARATSAPRCSCRWSIRTTRPSPHSLRQLARADALHEPRPAAVHAAGARARRLHARRRRAGRSGARRAPARRARTPRCARAAWPGA